MISYSIKKKILYLSKLILAEQKLRIRNNSQLYYVFQYLRSPNNLNKFIKQGDLLKFCDDKRNQFTNGEKPNYKDNSRAVESLRKNKLPLEWIEIKKKGELYFKYCPENKQFVSNDIIERNRYKNVGFSKELINSKLEECNYLCEITGLPSAQGQLAADHFIPKEKGGLNNKNNCIIINKILNEKKNNHDPVAWFCKSILTNFINICKRTGMDLNKVKDQINFTLSAIIQEA